MGRLKRHQLTPFPENPLDIVRRERPEAVERLARHLFDVDSEVPQDRRNYREFDQMPPNLQGWWLDRAAGRLLEQ